MEGRVYLFVLVLLEAFQNKVIAKTYRHHQDFCTLTIKEVSTLSLPSQGSNSEF